MVFLRVTASRYTRPFLSCQPNSTPPITVSFPHSENFVFFRRLIFLPITSEEFIDQSITSPPTPFESFGGVYPRSSIMSPPPTFLDGSFLSITSGIFSHHTTLQRFLPSPDCLVRSDFPFFLVTKGFSSNTFFHFFQGNWRIVFEGKRGEEPLPIGSGNSLAFFPFSGW